MGRRQINSITFSNLIGDKTKVHFNFTINYSQNKLISSDRAHVLVGEKLSCMRGTLNYIIDHS